MDGNLLIADAREFGLDSGDIYRPYNKLYAAVRGFMDAEYFGVSAYDDELGCWVPKHVNGAHNPKPCRDFFGRPCRRRFKKRDLILHLATEPTDSRPQFRFLVNSPRTSFHLLGWDIDASCAEKADAITCDVYHDCFVSEWNYGGNVFIERSRNRKGRYIWTIIERSSPPAEFNMLINTLSRALRAKYRTDPDNGFDAIKGSLHYESRDEAAKLWAEMDGDLNDDHRGVLITLPLAGSVARGAFEDEGKAFLGFLTKRNRRFVNAIPQPHLRSLLALYAPEEARVLDADVAKLTATTMARGAEDGETGVVSSPSSSPTVGNNLRMSAPSHRNQTTRDRLISKARVDVSGKNRMRLASSLYFYTHGRYAPSAEALVAFYKAEGFARGDDGAHKTKLRLRRAQDVLVDHTANPAKLGYERAYWLNVITRYVTNEVREHEAVRYRSPRTKRVMLVEDELLAAGLYVLTLSAFAANRTDRMHSCSQAGQESMYRKLAAAGLLRATFEDKRKRVAVPVLLQLAGLVVLRDGNWKFGGRCDGVGNRYGLGQNHPRFREFTSLYGHVVDPRSLPCIVSQAVSIAG